jgi:hypothetical protein
VIHGSALEKLIQDHQDFEVLRPAEADDGQPMPPWLRVYWRKLHPDGDYSGDSPSGGYPLILRDLHEWMVEHQNLEPGEGVPDDMPSDPTPPATN